MGARCARPEPRRCFGLAHLLAWAKRGESANLADVPADSPPFTSASMSDQPDASPPLLPGGLFVAIKGERRDGHEFVKSAFERGARAALVARVPENLVARSIREVSGWST